MGRAGRVACIGLPYLFTIGSLVALIFAGIGSTDEDSSTLNKIYFMRVSFGASGRCRMNQSLLTNITG